MVVHSIPHPPPPKVMFYCKVYYFDLSPAMGSSPNEHAFRASVFRGGLWSILHPPLIGCVLWLAVAMQALVFPASDPELNDMIPSDARWNFVGAVSSFLIITTLQHALHKAQGHKARRMHKHARMALRIVPPVIAIILAAVLPDEFGDEFFWIITAVLFAILVVEMWGRGFTIGFPSRPSPRRPLSASIDQPYNEGPRPQRTGAKFRRVVARALLDLDTKHYSAGHKGGAKKGGGGTDSSKDDGRKDGGSKDGGSKGGGSKDGSKGDGESGGLHAPSSRFRWAVKSVEGVRKSRGTHRSGLQTAGLERGASGDGGCCSEEMRRSGRMGSTGAAEDANGGVGVERGMVEGAPSREEGRGGEGRGSSETEMPIAVDQETHNGSAHAASPSHSLTASEAPPECLSATSTPL